MKQTETQKNWNEYFDNPPKGNDNKPVLLIIILLFVCISTIIYFSNNPDEISDIPVNTQNNNNNVLWGSMYDYDLNGEGFHYAMETLEAYTDKLNENLTAKELKNAAKEVEQLNVHKMYIDYRDAVAAALYDKAALLKKEKSLSYITEWRNETIVELFDIMEECFINAGISYERKSDTQIYYEYKTYSPTNYIN